MSHTRYTSNSLKQVMSVPTVNGLSLGIVTDGIRVSVKSPTPLNHAMETGSYTVS